MTDYYDSEEHKKIEPEQLTTSELAKVLGLILEKMELQIVRERYGDMCVRLVKK